MDPEFDHLHGLSDGIFIPGVRPFGAPLAGVPTDHAAIGLSNGLRIHMRGSVITIGDESGSDFIALAAKVDAELGSIATAIGSTPGFHGTGSYTHSGSVGASQAKAK